MTKRERVLATLRREETDRVPYSVYVHSTVRSRGVERFVKFTLDFYDKYDPDYIKVMFDENYDTPVDTQFMRGPADWRLLEELDPHLGAFGRQLEILRRIRDTVGPDVPIIQTIYSPFHIGIRLAARRILEDLREDPEAVRAGLEAIARSTAGFAEACVRVAKTDGFFLGAIGAERAWLTPEEYTAHAMPADRLLLPSLRTGEILIVHIHGQKDSYFDLLSDYECDALSWEDRLAGPSLAEARTKTDRAFVGGVDHVMARSGSPEAIIAQARESIAATGGRGLILAPGCTLAGDTPPANILAFKRAVTESA